MENENTLKRTARIAGIFWLLVALSGGFTIGYVRSGLVVPGDAALTAANIVNNETLFRAGNAVMLINMLFLLALGLTVFKMFRTFSRAWTNFLIAGMLLNIAALGVSMINNSAAVYTLTRPEFVAAFSTEQVNQFAMMFLRLASSSLGVAEVFMGVFLTCFGVLIIRTRCIPRVLGALMIAGALAFLFNTLNKIVAPQFFPAQFTQAAMFTNAAAIIPTILWLIVMGAKGQNPKR